MLQTFIMRDFCYFVASRKKFAQLSRMFSRGGSKRSGVARVPPRGPPDSLLLQEEHSDDEDRPQHTNKV